MSHPFSSNQPRAKHGFTLAELLAVIVIMALLMAVVIPNISGMTRGASLRGATMQVRTALVQARQTAITRRADASVLFPTTIPNDNPKNYRAIAVMASNYTGSWMVANWEFLPAGTVFKLNPSLTYDKVLGPVDGTTSNMMSACTFNRLGERTGAAATSASATALQFYLMEGFVSGSTVVTNKTSGMNIIDVLYPAGIVQVKRAL